MKLELLKRQIEDNLFEDMKSAIIKEEDFASVTINTHAGIIEAEAKINGKVNVFISHNHGKERNDENLKALVEDAVSNADWEEARYLINEENTPTFEEEYAMYGESLFPLGLQWHRL